MSLIAVHRLLISTFIAFAVFFGWLMMRRYLGAEETAGLAGAVVSWAVAIAATVYLLRAPYLRRK